MRYFQPAANTRFYAGVDRHARSLFLIVLDYQGQTRYARNLPANPQAFRKACGLKAVLGSKTKCDHKDAEAIVRLLKSGNFPLV